MSESGKAWDMRRIEQLRSDMSASAIATLKSKGQKGAVLLTLDEVGVLYLLARERIRELEKLSEHKK